MPGCSTSLGNPCPVDAHPGLLRLHMHCAKHWCYVPSQPGCTASPAHTAAATSAPYTIAPALQASLAAEMFNSGRMGWEPVIEPWAFSVGLTLVHSTEPLTRSPDAAGGPSCMSASFASDAVLEGTMTLAQFDTAAAAMRVVRQVPRCLLCVLEDILFTSTGCITERKLTRRMYSNSALVQSHRDQSRC